MASSSSAKKVARVAAKSGSGKPAGADPANNRNWLFALAIVAIVALGIGIVAFARDKNGGTSSNTAKPRANLTDGSPYDHWHAAFAIDVCGTELSPLQDGPTDILGIHTHGDGLIHIHPFTTQASGPRATLSRFFKQVSLKVTNDGFQLPKGMTVEGGGTTVKEGVTTCGGKPGEMVLAYWKDGKNAPTASKPDKIYRSNFGAVHFAGDLGAYTLAFVPKGSTDIKPPSSAADIEQLGAADAGSATPQSGGSTPATAPATAPATQDTTPTTAAGSAG